MSDLNDHPGKPVKVCEKHPKYVGLRRPTATCEACWQIWFGIAEICINCGCQERLVEIGDGCERL